MELKTTRRRRNPQLSGITYTHSLYHQHALLLDNLESKSILTMLEQALANVMNLGLNCRQVIGPVCFPSNKATFMPLSAFHT